MLRNAPLRLLASSSRTVRPLSTSPAALAKIRRADGSTVRPGAGESTSTSSNKPSSSSASPASDTPPSPPLSSASASGSSPAAATGVETAGGEEKFDYSDLPSLNIETVSESARIEQQKKDAAEGSEGEGTTGGGQKRTGAGRKQYVSSIERQRRMWLRYGISGLLAGGVGYAVYQAMNAEPGDTAESQWKRFKASVSETFDVFNKPAFKTLLPDPLPPPHQRPYTLLIDLEGMLVSSTWDRVNGWKTAKRPGVDYFLAYLSQFYEIVLFTSQPLYTAAPVAEKLDPYQAYLPYKLFRESTRTVGGKTVKDLSYLNRDLSKVIILETNPEHCALQPENAVIMKPWDGRPGDKGLVEMIPFLESIGIYAPKDVRPALKFYQGKDIPTEYAKVEAASKKAAEEEWQRQHPNAVHGAGSGLLSSLFGSISAQPGQSRPAQPMTYLEQKRAIAQRQYQEEQKYWKDHEEEFAKLIEEDKQRQLAEMKGTLWGFFSGGQGPQGQPGAPGAEAQAQPGAQGQAQVAASGNK